MDQELALEILLDGHHVLLTGPAGSGKTYVLNEFIKQAKRAGKHVSVTATTGLAATHLGGSTIHSWSGLGIHDTLPKYYVDDLTKARRETIEKTDVLIIDEISMLHDYRLDLIDEALRKVRGEDKPFGGIQVVLSGDFYQLPPISREGDREGGFAVDAEVWNDMDPVICYLSSQYRQTDNELSAILQAMRDGDLRRKHAEALLKRVGTDVGEVTELHTTNIDVDRINFGRLSAIEDDEYTYEMETTGRGRYLDSLKKSCLAQEELRLKKNALVMFVKNNPEKRYANGTLGRVKSFESHTHLPVVETLDGRKIKVSQETWELRDGDKKRASITQIPLRLAWAITVHKSQGMTLDGAVIDLRRAFVEGMGYVALSRVRDLENLSLIGINKMALKVSDRAIEIDSQLRTQAQKDAARLAHLRENAKKRVELAKKTSANSVDGVSSWKEKLEKMRSTYPNAYRPWQEEDDKKLIEMFAGDKPVPIKELTTVFGRHPGSIRARLKKHFGEDAVV